MEGAGELGSVKSSRFRRRMRIEKDVAEWAVGHGDVSRGADIEGTSVVRGLLRLLNAPGAFLEAGVSADGCCHYEGFFGPHRLFSGIHVNPYGTGGTRPWIVGPLVFARRENDCDNSDAEDCKDAHAEYVSRIER